MKLSKLAFGAAVTSAFCWIGCLILVFVHHDLTDFAWMWKSFHNDDYTLKEVIILCTPLFTVAMLITGLVLDVIIAVIFKRQFVKPLAKAEKFALSVSRGEDLPPLPQNGRIGQEAQNLFRSLNKMYDRQKNLISKHRQHLAHDLEMQSRREKFDQLKLDFFGDILPESRRTIGILRGHRILQLLRLRYDDSAEANDTRKLLTKSLARLDSIARDQEMILDISRLDWERWNSPCNDNFDAAEFIHDLLESNRLASRARQVHLVNQISSDLPGKLRIDRELLQQLLNILLRSACQKAAPHSEVVFNCTKDERKEARFEMTFETGAAVDPEKVTADFFNSNRFDDTDAPREVNSLGLALEIVSNTAGLIGVTVSVDSPASRKLRFSLSLPGGSSVYEAGAFSSLPNHPLFPVGREPESGSSMDVLLIEDDSEVSSLLTELLSFFHFKIATAGSIDECRSLLADKKFSAALATSQLNNEEPSGLVEQLRKLPGGDLPLVFASPALAETIHRKLEMYSDVWCMTMPLDYDLLAELLRRISR